MDTHKGKRYPEARGYIYKRSSLQLQSYQNQQNLIKAAEDVKDFLSSIAEGEEILEKRNFAIDSTNAPDKDDPLLLENDALEK